MTERFGHIKNPLSIIAIFAGIAEISGTLVLPHISPEHQGVFIWFLMLFPSALVLLFFITLWCKHQSLYAPSDWKDEANFFRGKARPSTAEEITLKQEQSITDGSESTPSIATPKETVREPNFSTEDKEEGASPAPRNAFQKQRLFARAEDLLVKKLEKELGGQITRNMTFVKSKENRLVVDGVLRTGNKMTLMEFIVFPQGYPSRPRVFTAASRFLASFAELFTEASNIVQTPVIAIAGRGPEQTLLHELEHKLWQVRPQFRYFDLDELEREFGTNVQEGTATGA